MRVGHDDSCFRTSRSESYTARTKTLSRFLRSPTIADDLVTGVGDKPPNNALELTRDSSAQTSQLAGRAVQGKRWARELAKVTDGTQQ